MVRVVACASAAVIAVVVIPSVALAATITPARTTPQTIATSIEAGEPSFGSGVVTGAAFQTIPPEGNPAAVSDTLSDFPTDGAGFAILSSGDATFADDPNTAPNSTGFNGGGSVRGNTDFDVTVLDLTLNVPATVEGLTTNCLQFDFRFLSEEFPEYKNSQYNDAFIAELDPSLDNRWTTSGSTISAPANFAFDEDGNEISINALGEARVTADNATGTTYDGATGALVASTPVAAGTHHLFLSIFDQGDAAFDSAVFVDALRVGHAAAGGCTAGARRQISGISITTTGEFDSTPTGVVTTPLADIPLTGVSQHEDPAPVGTAPFGKAPFGKAPFGKAPFGKAPFGKAPFGKAPFGKAPFGKAPFGKAPFGKAPFGKAPFGKAPLAEYPILRTGGWEAILAQTCSFTSATPQSVTWQMLWSEADTCATPPPPLDPTSPDALRLDEILIASSPLADLPLLAFLMGNANWDGVARPPATPTSPATWDEELDLIPGCDLVVEADSIAEGVATGCDLGLTTLANRKIGDLSSTNALATAFWDLTISELNVKQSFLGVVDLAAITNQSAVVNCSHTEINCATDTLRDVANTVAESDPPGTAGAWAVDGTGQATGTFADLGAAISDASLSDLVIAFLDPTATPIETTPLSEFGFERLDSSNFVTHEIAFGVRCTESANLQVHARPDPTFTYRPESSRFSVGSGAFADLPDPASTDLPDPAPAGAVELTWDVPPSGASLCPAGQIGETQVRVQFDALAGFELGSFTPEAGAETATIARVDAAAGSRGSVDVVESHEPIEGPMPTVTTNSVTFSHLGGPGDVDSFAFDVPVGESLDVSLSHLSNDFQLVLYAPDGSSQAQSLRPSTTPFELPVGVEPVVDPTGTNTGVLPPPALQDIPFVAGNVLSGISDFRGNDPEFLSTIGVAGTGGDTTYVVQVSGANGASGPEPYALTIRSSAPVPLPPTPARTFPNSMPTTTSTLPTVGSNVDTLILYNHNRTVAEYGAAAATDIEAALQDLVTEGPNLSEPVNAVVVPTDTAGTAGAFSAWDTTPSSPELMNNVVRAINDDVDSLKTATNLDLANVKNVVIVGEGDLIPHAAIVDGTADGNEIGFVGETIFDGQSNHLTGAFATKHFLSDAPYGSIVPLSLKGQLLYLPQAAVGRLFGGPTEIVGAIDRFLLADGMADPRTASTEPRTAFESDYDFFADGGDVITGALGAQVDELERLSPNGTPARPQWTRQQFADAFAGTGFSTYRPADIVSPNGHFDQYRMLPAAGAATNDESDVYSTSDIRSGLSPTIFGSSADVNGDGVVDGDDDANAFYGDTSIIDGRLDCDGWGTATGDQNDGTAGDGVIDTDDDCTLIGYDGTPAGVTIDVVDGAFQAADGRLPTVFNAGDPDDPSVVASDFAWSVIDGRVDANGDGTVDGDDCHVDLVGTADVLGVGTSASGPNPCGFANPPDAADNGKVDLNDDGDITAADTCDGCVLGEDVTNGVINSTLAGRIFFSIGCHFGLNFPDSLSAAASARLHDWQQALSQQGTAVTIGNFGYGIGDTAVVGFQEEILGTFAENLDGSMTVGEALQDAQRDYMASMPSFTPYDLKILQELGTGGLPMYGVPGGGSASAAGVGGGEDYTGIPGLTAKKFEVTSDFDPGTSPDGRNFFSNNGEVQATHPYPIVPKVSGDADTIDGEVAHGAFPLSWGSVDEVVVSNYAFANATYDGSTIGGEPIEDAPAAKVVYPTAFGNVGTWYETDGTPHHQLVVLSGQFRSNETGDPANGTFRKYSSPQQWVVTYAPANVDDFLQPRFSQVTVLTTGTIEAAVNDEAGVAQVFAQVLRGNSYTNVPLSFDTNSGAWRATGITGTIREATLFAIDVNGNVGTANNGGPGFEAVPPEPPAVSIDLSGNQVGDTFVEPVTVTVSPANFKVKIDDGAVVDDPVTVSAEGTHTATAYEPDGTTATDVTVNFTIDTSDPTITITTPAGSNPIPMYVLDRPGDDDEPVFTNFTCDDPAGVALCVDQFGRPSGAVLDRSTLGTHTLTVTGRDASGHVTTLSHQYRVVKFEGFFDPVNNPPTVNTGVKAGGIIPVKWRLSDENGVGIADPTSFASVTATVEVSGECLGNTDTIEVFAGSSGLQYLGDGNWQFNWKTLKSYSGKCVVMHLNLYDGTTGPGAGHSAAIAKFKFK